MKHVWKEIIKPALIILFTPVKIVWKNPIFAMIGVIIVLYTGFQIHIGRIIVPWYLSVPVRNEFDFFYLISKQNTNKQNKTNIFTNSFI